MPHISIQCLANAPSSKHVFALALLTRAALGSGERLRPRMCEFLSTAMSRLMDQVAGEAEAVMCACKTQQVALDACLQSALLQASSGSIDEVEREQPQLHE